MEQILLFNPSIHLAGITQLKKYATLHFIDYVNEQQVIDYINEHNITTIITRMEVVTDRMITDTSTLKVIAKNGIGIDNISPLAAEYGIDILNVPDGNINAVVEYVLGAIFLTAKKAIQHDKNVRTKQWQQRDIQLTEEVANKKILLIGFGNIAQKLAEKLFLFHLQVYAFDPYVSEAKMSFYNVKRVNQIHEVLADMDYVSIHVPLTEQTHHLLSDQEFNHFKKGAVLIHASRGGVVDEEALLRAIDKDIISQAVLDVSENEPSYREELRINERIILTPHIAGVTEHSKMVSAQILADTIIQYHQGKKPYNLVNV